MKIYEIQCGSNVQNKWHRFVHLLRKDIQEDMCFGLYMPSQGAERFTGLITDVIAPKENERYVHGNVSFTAEYFLRALNSALKKHSGIAIMHSHPSGMGWQDMSSDDCKAEQILAPTTLGGTGLPLVGMTLSGDHAWSGRIWEKVGYRKYRCKHCENVRVVGSRLIVSFNPKLRPAPRFKPELTRTVSAWGPDVQAQISRLRIGIVGLGGVGDIIAEVLARSGIKDMCLIDFDSVEMLNLDRLLHAYKKDALKKRAKVKVTSKAIKKGATADGFSVKAIEFSVIEPEGFKRALDCDVLFSCVDRPWPRSVLNFIAYAHLIPVIDGGVKIIVNSSNKTLKKAYWGAHVIGPTRRCMACLEQYDPGLVSAERDGLLDDPNYISGLPKDDPLRHNENVICFNLSVASMEITQFLSMSIAPHGLSNIGAQLYNFVTGELNQAAASCDKTCPFPKYTGLGDRANVVMTSRHPMAEQARANRMHSD